MFRTLTFATLAATAALALTAVAPPAAEAAGCGGFAYATPFRPGKVSKSNCGVLGSPGTKVYYSWAVGSPSSGKACLEGTGFEPLIGPYPGNGPRPDVEHWYSLGCGTRGGSAVPWGNVAAVPKVRAESLSVPLGVPVRWSH